MYRLLSVDERRKKRKDYSQNPIYLILYTPLWNQRGDDLSPEDVWYEANRLAYVLRESSMLDERIRFEQEYDDLCTLYSSFVVESGRIIERTAEQSQHSAMMVSMAAFFLLLNIHPTKEGHPHGLLCKHIFDVVKSTRGFNELYEGARDEEDVREKAGKLIEVTDFIEYAVKEDVTLDEQQIQLLHKVVGDFVSENSYSDISTMRENERMLSSVNDRNNHCIQDEVDLLRKNIRAIADDKSIGIKYRNIIFNSQYNDKISFIREALNQFVQTGAQHIDSKEKRQWQAIIEPLKIIPELLITHDERPKHKQCTNEEICSQMDEFFGKEIGHSVFEGMPKSISGERTKWKREGIGLTIEDWNRFINQNTQTHSYYDIVKIAQRVYGELLKAIRREV